MLSWDDIRVALTLSEAGSLTQAARSLGVDPTTVSRRISALEETLGVPLFVRLSTGWRPTEPGERVLAAAQDAALAMRRAEFSPQLYFCGGPSLIRAAERLASSMSSPRAFTMLNRSRSLMTPAASSAAYSPTLKPA